MALPIRTTLEDVDDVCAYIATKPTGASLAEAKSVLDPQRLDGRKLSALKYWGLLADNDGEKLALTPTGRELAKGAAWRTAVLAAIIKNIPPYRAIIERAHHKKEESVTATDVAAHWFEHFREEVSDSDSMINAQAVCFFHIAVGAELGKLVPGRRGMPTRFEFSKDGVQEFVQNRIPSSVSVSGVGLVSSTRRPPPVTLQAKADQTPKQPTEYPTSAEDVISSQGKRTDGSFLQRGLEVDCYKLVQRLGSGFSAEVWSATVERVPIGVDLVKNQEVAIKFYTANALAIPDQVIRVEREYRVAQRLRHPHLIRIYEFILASPRPHHNFLVMDVAPGPALSSVISKNKFEATDALKMLAQILSGADALHESGALHRDIKPGNISYSVSESGSPHCVLLDLGIVSPMFEKGVTAVSRFVGSKHWAPLEQLIGEALDQRSDLYSVGAVAYNLLVGVEPFSGSATEAAVAVEMSRGGLKIPELATLPSEITEMFNSCLSNLPSQRPRTARECLAVLKKHGIEP